MGSIRQINDSDNFINLTGGGQAAKVQGRKNREQ
jgi:hypothetical protein